VTSHPRVLTHDRDDVSRSVWEAVRVSRYYGLQALNHLANPGHVAIDPDAPAVYFFVPAGTVQSWRPMPAGGGLTVMSEEGLRLPPQTRRTPPGAYWLVSPARGAIRSCDGPALHRALLDCLPDEVWAKNSPTPPRAGALVVEPTSTARKPRRGFRLSAQTSAVGTPAFIETLPRIAASVPTARHMVHHASQVWRLNSDLAESGALIFTELVANSVAHALGDSVLATVAQLDEDGLYLSVSDRSSERPSKRSPGEYDIGGRGLLLVNHLSQGRWGADEKQWGKSVWAEVRQPCHWSYRVLFACLPAVLTCS
jgi:serine/threonine-protein kinase RsbW